MHIAADIGSGEILSCLLKAGADPNIADEVGYYNLCLHSQDEHIALEVPLDSIICMVSAVLGRV